MTSQIITRIAAIEAELKLIKKMWIGDVKKKPVKKKKSVISEGEQMAIRDWENRGKKRNRK